MIEYIDDGKRAIFNGLVFVRDDQTGYYLNSTLHIRLHRAVYEYYYGKIPNGYHVHHVDHDKANNDPDNLIALSRSDHLKLHEDELTCEQREARVENIVSHAVPAAVAWHKSEEGRAWHLAHYEQMKDALHRRAWHVCDHCGRDFYGLANGTVRFCSNACKSAWRRKAGLDDIVVPCKMCGRMFTSNKYKKAQTCSRSCAKKWRAEIRKGKDHTA